MSKSIHISKLNADVLPDEIYKSLARIVIKDIQQKINKGIYPPNYKKTKPGINRGKEGLGGY